MKVLFVSSEVAPFSKTGGLADVSSALPAALAALGVDLKVVTPLYASVRRGDLDPRESFAIQFPFGLVALKAYSAAISPQHEVLLLEQSAFFNRAGIYNEGGIDYPDNHRRFATLSIGALAWGQARGFIPDIVHLNDWPTGLAAVALQRGYRGSNLAAARTIFTIHNLAYQGLFPRHVMPELGLPWNVFTSEALEFHDQLSFIKAGIGFADALTTVSRTYAKEIVTPEFGEGLDGFLRRRRDRLVGISNGIDTTEWNPREDPLLPAHFDVMDMSGKATCKSRLQEQLRLKIDPQIPLFSSINRLVPQKGIEILINAVTYLLDAAPLQMIVLGSGEAHFEIALRRLADRFPGQIAVQFGFDERLAHLLEAGSDFFVMPSLYEPCGLNQMYSLRYGTVPIVRATGGLEDTVVDLSLPDGTGIKFTTYSTIALRTSMQRALDLFRDQNRLLEVRRRGMMQDFDWNVSAREYLGLYRSLTAGPTPPRAR